LHRFSRRAFRNSGELGGKGRQEGRWHGVCAYNTSGGLAIKILEADLRAFAERRHVYVDWEAVDEDD